MSWEEASHRISDVGGAEDPSKPPVPGCNADYLRFRLRRVVESLWFRAATLLLIVVDIIIIVVDLSAEYDEGRGSGPSALMTVDLVGVSTFKEKCFIVRLSASKFP